MRRNHKPGRFVLTAVVLAAGWVVVASARADLVAHYTFDEAGDLGADAAGTNPGTAVGDAQQAAGRVGAGALLLDGDGDYMIVGGNADFEALDDDGDGWTLASWVRTTGNGEVQRIFSALMPGGWAGGGWGAGLRQDRGSDEFISTTYGIVDMQASAAGVLDGRWHHVAYVFRNEGGTIATDYYVNGSVVGTDAPGNGFGIISTSVDYGIGALQLPTVPALQYFNGALDDLRIYGNELSPEEILLLVPEPGIASLWLTGLLCALPFRRRRADAHLSLPLR